MRKGKPIYNEDNSLNRIEWFKAGTVLIMPDGRRNHTPSESDFLEAGFLPEVMPVLKRFEQPNMSVDICPFGSVIITHPVIQQDIDSVRLSLKTTVENIADQKVHSFVPARKVRRFNAKANKLNRKAIKHLKDPANNPDLTAEEEALIAQLELMEETAEAILEAEDSIVEEINDMTDAEIYDLPEDWEENHPSWP